MAPTQEFLTSVECAKRGFSRLLKVEKKEGRKPTYQDVHTISDTYAIQYPQYDQGFRVGVEVFMMMKYDDHTKSTYFIDQVNAGTIDDSWITI